MASKEGTKSGQTLRHIQVHTSYEHLYLGLRFSSQAPPLYQTPTPPMPYYLMSIHEHLPPQARKQLKEVGWAKGIELAKLARRDRQHFDCATWLHKARQMPK